ncbi:MAG: helix-turn-helix domain-containing protein [Deltaproteobacteria bacterium]|jgi:hypothetical protein|nr:helix-turn-helix domain-containing protein [Deltaproteobacteria bacterium]
MERTDQPEKSLDPNLEASIRRIVREEIALILGANSQTNIAELIDRKIDDLLVQNAEEPLTTQEVALEYGLSPNYLSLMRVEGRGPNYIKKGRKVFYKRKDLAAYFASQKMKKMTQTP